MLNFKKILAALTRGVCILIAPFLSISAAKAEAEPTKILFIGNSYTHMNNMPSIFEKIALKAGKSVHVEKNTHSGFCFREHAQREDMFEAIKSDQWDYVILQGFSREFSFAPEYIDTATVPFVKQITDSVYANNPCTNVLLYMTWGYEDGFKEREEVNTYDKMADSIARGYQYVGDLFKVPVVPVGMVWKQVKESSEIDLYADDRAHPSLNGSYLIATTFYTAIFGSDEETELFAASIRSEDAAIIKREAFTYLRKHRTNYKLDRNRFLLRPYTTMAGDYELEVQGEFPEASAIMWQFGDGKEMTEWKGVHRYKKHGDYTVRVEVNDGCGMRSHEEVVRYQKMRRCRRNRREKETVNSSEG